MAVTYTLAQMRVEVAENVGLDDGAGGILIGRKVTSTIIDKYLNRRYYEAITLMAEKYPADHERVSEAPLYKTSGTISTVSNTTLTATSTIFNNSMVGDTIYNFTQGTTMTISAYTSTSVVTVSSDLEDASWASTDTIYVIGHEFTFGGDADDVRYPIAVRVKYNSTDTTWTECEERMSSAVFKTGAETYSQNNPIWYRTNASVSGVVTYAVGVLPENDTVFTSINGLQVTYIQMPAKLSNDTDVPNLPLGSQHILISGATIDTLRKLRRNSEIAEYKEEWMLGKAQMVGNYSRGYVRPRKGQRTQNEYNMRTRRI